MKNMLITLLLTFLWAAPASAQQYDDPPPRTQPEVQPVAAPIAEGEETITITVSLKHGDDGRLIGDAPVFLRAARPRGPFEPTAPRPQFEWASFADAQGVATFSQIPRDLATSGLRVHAVTTYDGLAFESSAAPPLDGSQLEIVLWEKGLDPSVVAISNLRTVVEMWESYLVFTQYYTLTNTGKTALDVKLLPGEEFERGLPFVLPVKAQAINVMGPGESEVVNSTFFWKGVIEPGANVNLQVRFSMVAKNPEFTYEQEVGWVTQNVEIVVPIQTKFEKIPRLDKIELRPLNFSETDRGAGIFGLRDDVDFVGARGLELKPGQSFNFQLRGLPFKRPSVPWYFLGLGLLSAIVLIAFARRELRTAASRAGRDDLRRILEEQRVALLDGLVAVERDLAQGTLTRSEAEFESAALREQLALVLKKLTDLETSS